MSAREELAEVQRFWSEKGFEDLHRRLQVCGEEVQGRQEASKRSRKELSEKLRDFKQADARTKMEQVPELIQRFKAEVDFLTQRARTAEKGIMSTVTEWASEAPDPRVALDRLWRSQEREAVLKRDMMTLQEDNEAFEAELRKLHNQDVTLRDLEDRLARFDDEVEQRVEKRVAEREQDLRIVFDEELTSIRESERQAEERARRAQEASLQSQQATDVAQTELFELRSKMEEDAAAHRAEVEMLSNELERVHAEANQLRTELRQARSSSREAPTKASPSSSSAPSTDVSSRARVEEAEADAQRHAEEAARLARDMRQLQDAVAEERKRLHAQQQQWREALQEKEAEEQRLRRELAERPTQEERAALLQEVQALKSMFMYDGEADQSTEQPISQADGDENEGHSQQKVMLRRIRHLESSVIRAKRDLSNMETEVEDVRAKLDKATEQASDQADLIVRLEEALRQETGGAAAPVDSVLCGAATQNARATTTTTTTTTTTRDSAGDATGASTLQAILGSPEEEAGASLSSAASSPAPLPASALSAAPLSDADAASTMRMVDILREQRDRFRARMLELEQEAESARQRAEESATRAGRLQEDNVDLFGQIRYLQSLVGPGQTGGAVPGDHDDDDDDGGGGGNSDAGDIEQAANNARGSAGRRRVGEAGKGSVAGRYSPLYEEVMNPFAEFRQRERASRVRRLGPMDRILHTCTRLVALSPLARTGIAGYIVLLHALVFVTLWLYTHRAHDCDDHAY